jgi:hypothetical protein
MLAQADCKWNVAERANLWNLNILETDAELY